MNRREINKGIVGILLSSAMATTSGAVAANTMKVGITQQGNLRPG
jgi:hypothetical protein